MCGKRILAGFIFSVIAISVSAQIASWQWTQGAGGGDIQEEQDIATDKNGNVFVTGYFGGPTISFGSITFQNSISPRNVFFIAKYSPTGSVLWARSASSYQSTGCALATDNAGNVYVSGNFQTDTIAFDSTNVLVNHASTRSFVVKYDSSGNVKGVFAATGSYLYDVNSVVSDGSNFYVSGSFTNSLTLGSYTLNSPGTTRSGFIAKYSDTGNVIWARMVETTDSTTLFCNSISIDRHGHLYVAGNSYGQGINAGGLISSGVGRYNVFAAKYDTAGNAIWIKSGGSDFNIIPKDLVADEVGNVYITGLYYGDSISFGPYTLHSANQTQSFQYSDFFQVRLDSAGDVQWVKTAGETGKLDAGYSLAADTSKHIYISGGFGRTFQYGATILTAPTGSKDAMFILVLGEDGKIICSDVQRSGGDDQSSIVLDGHGSAYVGGDFEDSLFADNHGLTLVGDENIFVAKYTCNINVGIAQPEPGPIIRVYPNPSSSIFYFDGLRKDDLIEIYDLTGRIISKVCQQDNDKIYNADLSTKARGVYFYTIAKGDEVKYQGKLIVE